MKILIATPYFHPKVGGLEIYAEQIARQLVSSGHDVHIVTSGDTNSDEDLDGMTIHRLRTWVSVSNTPVSPLWSWQIRRLIASLRPDVVNVHAPVPSMALAATLAAGKIPLVVTYHTGSMKKGAHLVDALISVYESLVLPWMLNRADHIICASDFVRDTFLASWMDKSSTVSPGVDTDTFVPSNDPATPGRIMFVGDFRDSRKGLEVLLEAVRLLPDMNLRVVGPGEPKPETGVEYAGVVRGDALVREIQNGQILVLPSTTDNESFGMVLIEAMACGLPVIGSKVGGIALVIDDGVDGSTVPANDPIALAKAIGTLAADPEKAIRMGKAGRRKVERLFTWKSRGEDTLDVYADASGRPAIIAQEVRHG